MKYNAPELDWTFYYIPARDEHYPVLPSPVRRLLGRVEGKADRQGVQQRQDLQRSLQRGYTQKQLDTELH